MVAHKFFDKISFKEKKSIYPAGASLYKKGEKGWCEGNAFDNAFDAYWASRDKEAIYRSTVLFALKSSL